MNASFADAPEAAIAALVARARAAQRDFETWNQERVDATHVKFSDSADDMAWANVLGKVKFKVLDVKQK